MKGQIIFGKKKLNKALLLIKEDNSNVLTKVESDAKGWVAFQLPLQKSYTINVTKYGFVSKIITVDTRIPESQQKGDYYFGFTIELFEEIAELDVSVLKEPVAKIFFNTFTKKFDYDYNYTVKINNELRILHKNYERIKKKKKTRVGPNKNVHKPDSITSKQEIFLPSATIKNEPTVTFSVEILSSAEQIPKNSPQFKGIINVREYKEGEQFKYFVGEYKTKEDAEKMKEQILGYFPSASIAAFKEGKIVPIE